MDKKTVLIVEDDNDLRNAYVTILRSVSIDVRSAKNGKDALDLIGSEGFPGIIFLDLQMPIMDGLNFLKKFNAPSHPETEVIVFSNYDAKKETDEAYEQGAKRYVLKARATPKELIHIVQTILL